MILAVVGFKGGSGKTTSSMYLAHALGATVVDTDKQGSAVEWAEVASAAGTPLTVPVISLPTARLAGRLPLAPHLVIDTPPGDPAITQAAIEVADVVIVPTAPTALDVSRVWSTLDVVTAAGKPAYVLLCRARRTRSINDVDQALTDDSATVLTTRIPLREALALAWGRPITELYHYDEAAAEISERTAR